MKPLGGVLTAIGAVLAFSGLVWGWTGFYAYQVPMLLGMLLGGGLLLFIGGRMRKGDGRPRLPEGARVVRADTAAAAAPVPAAPAGVPRSPAPRAPIAVPVAASVPVTVTETPARIPANATAETLAALAAADATTWSEISRHPNVYPALLEWIAAQRAPVLPVAAEILDEERSRAADPATDPHDLADIAHRRADLRGVVAANPAAYDGLREWIAQYPA